MLPFQSYYGCGSRTDGLVHGLDSMEMIGRDSATNLKSTPDTKTSAAACKSHSEAERRRRARINTHLATLRTLLPNKIKTDKASLLSEVVHHVKGLKRLAADMAAQDSREWTFPSESDELSLSYCESDELIRVSLSCEDRPDLLKDLTQALTSAGVRVVKAEMGTVGGRTKSELVIERRVGGRGGDEELGVQRSTLRGEELSTLRRTLKAVIDKPAVSVAGLVVPGNKRPCLSLSHQFFSHR